MQLPYTTSDAAITRALPTPKRGRPSQLGPIEPRTPRKAARSSNPNPTLTLTLTPSLTLARSQSTAKMMTRSPSAKAAARGGGECGAA